MFDPVILFSILGRDFYAYGVWIAASSLVCALLLSFYAPRRGLPKGFAWSFYGWCVPLCTLLGHLFYCLVRAPHLFPGESLWLLLTPWAGGFGLGGVLAGGALAALIAARRHRIESAHAMDAVAPFAALMLALSRFGEWLDGAGHGAYIENEALQFFPLGIKNMYDEYFYSLFLAEGLVALLICALLLRYAKKAPPKGYVAFTFLTLFGASQIPLESLRRDQFLRWGFVRVGELVALALILITLAVFTARARKQGVPLWRLLLDWAIAALCAGVGIAMEFAFDKSDLPNWIGYLLMGGAVCVMAWRVLLMMRLCAGKEARYAENASVADDAVPAAAGSGEGGGSGGHHERLQDRAG